MIENLIIPALIRLLDFASIRRFNLKNKEVNFKDEIGKKAIEINDKIKSKHSIDIFSKKLNPEDLSKFEHLVGNAMSNHVNKNIVPRKVSDEVEILKQTEIIDPKILDQFEISFSQSVIDTVNKITKIQTTEFLESIKNPLALSHLPDKELGDQYFALSKISKDSEDYYFISTLRHESREIGKLSIAAFLTIPKNQYSIHKNNPTQLFLKGLDKYGIDMKINNKLSRYYKEIDIPLNTNLGSTEFLNLQNIDASESFMLAMMVKQTAASMNMKNVFAIKTDLLLQDINN